MVVYISRLPPKVPVTVSVFFFTSFIIPSNFIVQIKQLYLIWHFTWKIRGSNSYILGTNKKEGRISIAKYFFLPHWTEPKILKLHSWYGNNISVKKFYPWHLSIPNIFTWCMSFLFLQSLESCADFPRKDKQSVVARLWITKLNKHFYEQHRIFVCESFACETSAPECSVCFHYIVFFPVSKFVSLMN